MEFRFHRNYFRKFIDQAFCNFDHTNYIIIHNLDTKILFWYEFQSFSEHITVLELFRKSIIPCRKSRKKYKL